MATIVLLLFVQLGGTVHDDPADSIMLVEEALVALRVRAPKKLREPPGYAMYCITRIPACPLPPPPCPPVLPLAPLPPEAE